MDVYVELVLLRQGRAFASEPSKHTFIDYTRAQFIHDFYEFTGRQRLAHQGHVVKVHALTKSQTDNPAKSMWIVEGDSPYDGRFTRYRVREGVRYEHKDAKARRARRKMLRARALCSSHQASRRSHNAA